MVIVTRVQRHPARPPRIGYRAHNVLCRVAIEWRDLDGDQIVELGQSPPEVVAERAATNSGLQIEAKEGKHLGHAATMFDELVVRCAPQRAKLEQNHIVSQIRSQAGFVNGLDGASTRAGDKYRPVSTTRDMLPGNISRELQHWLQEAD